jgi:lipid-A-disaccharide synthase
VHIFISTGDVSGDLQGSFLVQSLQKLSSSHLTISALGGKRMAAAGAQIIADTTTISSMGLVESIPYILPTLRVQSLAKKHLAAHPPDLIILVDYLGPNVVIGRYARKTFPHTPIVYYIAPQNWVWSPGDNANKTIVEISDLILAIFPEEARFYREKGAKVQFIGHPLRDRFVRPLSKQDARTIMGLTPQEKVITLLPASRNQELKYLLPVILQAAVGIRDYFAPEPITFLLPLSIPSFKEKIAAIAQRVGLTVNIIETEQTAAIAAADLAITKSGTVNLELALMAVPQIVIYRLNAFTAWILRHLLRFDVPFISPVNLVTMEAIVPEFIQEEATPPNLQQVAIEILTEESTQEAILAGYGRMKTSLGEEGVCDRAAQAIFNLIN